MPDASDRRVEELRRALYRPGSSGEDLTSYLAVEDRPEPRGATVAPRPDLPGGGRIRGRAVTGVLILAVLLALPAAPGAAPRYRLPVPEVGDFSSAFPVPGGTAIGATSLWSSVRGSSMFASVRGSEVATASGSGRVFAAVAQAPVSALGTTPLTVFIACSTGFADIELTTITQDFDSGYQVPFATTRVRCRGVQGVRYGRPAGLVPNAVYVDADGPVAFSLVAGL